MKEREAFLDRLRVAATCAVVLLHTVTGIMDATDMALYPLEKRMFLIILDLVCWCVPVFLLISGYLFLNPARKLGMGGMLTKYCRRVVLALFLFGVPYAFLEQIAVERSLRWSMAGRAFMMVLRGESWSHMWYLYLILLLYLLTPGLRWLLFRMPRPAVYCLLSALLICCSLLPCVSRLFEWNLPAVLPEDGIYFFYYICGYLFASEKKKRNDGKERRVSAGKGLQGCLRHGVESGWLPGSAAVLLAVGMVCSRLSGNYTFQMAYNYPPTAALSLLLFGWGRAVGRTGSETGKKGNRFWSQAAALSFSVYLVHPVFLNIAYKVFHVTPLSFFAGVSIPVFLGLTLLFSVIAALLLRGIPPLRNYVL